MRTRKLPWVRDNLFSFTNVTQISGDHFRFLWTSPADSDAVWTCLCQDGETSVRRGVTRIHMIPPFCPQLPKQKFEVEAQTKGVTLPIWASTVSRHCMETMGHSNEWIVGGGWASSRFLGCPYHSIAVTWLCLSSYTASAVYTPDDIESLYTFYFSIPQFPQLLIFLRIHHPHNHLRWIHLRCIHLRRHRNPHQRQNLC